MRDLTEHELTSVALDLIWRTEEAATEVARVVVDTGVTMTARDIAEMVERGLPPGYPAPLHGDRLEFISRIANDLLTGALYDD